MCLRLQISLMVPGINSRLENFHGVQWLRLLAAEAGGPGSTQVRELRPHAATVCAAR